MQKDTYKNIWSDTKADTDRYDTNTNTQTHTQTLRTYTLDYKCHYERHSCECFLIFMQTEVLIGLSSLTSNHSLSPMCRLEALIGTPPDIIKAVNSDVKQQL